MNNELRFVPIKHWPRKPTPADARQRAQFKRTYDRRLAQLDRELTSIDARNVLIQLYLSGSQIRKDGWPVATARPIEPGVILTFEKGIGGPIVSMPCDTYEAWTDNLYAIALSLEALRAVNRYGVTTGNEQYIGFKMIAPPEVEEGPDWAYAVIAAASSKAEHLLRADRDLLATAVRLAATAAHPDKPGGSHESFVNIVKARDILFPKQRS